MKIIFFPLEILCETIGSLIMIIAMIIFAFSYISMQFYEGGKNLKNLGNQINSRAIWMTMKRWHSKL